MRSFLELMRDSNATGIRFVMTELELALSFLDIAEASSKADHGERSAEHARKAYRSAEYFLHRLHLLPGEAASIGRQMSRVRSRLESFSRKVGTEERS